MNLPGQISSLPTAAQLDTMDREIARHGPHAKNSRKPAPAPKAPAARPAAGSQVARTQEARNDLMREAIAGDRSALDHLRTEAAWFPDSTANGNRQVSAPASDAQIIAACRKALGLKEPAPAPGTMAHIDAAAVYAARNSRERADVPPVKATAPKTFGALAGRVYGGDAPSFLINSSGRGGAA